MDELVAKFLPRFAALARERLRVAAGAAAARRPTDAEAVAHELHALAGEAGLLGLEGVIGVARSAEEAARRFGGSGSESDAAAFADSVRSLEQAVAEATGGSSGA
jgi:HPt (histidine-containing phosphotransfer) domain-containing protein